MKCLKSLLILLIPLFLQNSYADSSKITVVQIGLIHNFHLDPQYHYPTSALIDLIKKIKPNLICGEAEKKNWDKGFQGLYPFENRFLEFAGSDFGATFAPVDWRSTFNEVKGLMEVIKANMSTEDFQRGLDYRDKVEKEFESTLTSNIGPNFFEYIHNDFWFDSAKYHIESDRPFGDIPNGFWYRRNVNIVSNCLDIAKERGSKVVLIAYGAEHQYIIDSLLRAQKDISVKRLNEIIDFNTIDLSPHQAPSQLINIFKNDLNTLMNAVSSGSLEEGQLATVKERRIPGLQMLIQELENNH